MAATRAIILCAAVLTGVSSSIIPKPQRPQNTIFGDEMLKDGIFENVDSSVFNRNAIATRSDDNPYRLPTTTKPERYNVLWAIDFANFALSGNVAIQLYATQAGVSEIVIHSDDQFINSATLTLGTTDIPVTMVAEPEYHFLRFNLTTGTLQYNAITPVLYTLTINFEGILRQDMYGIYRSWYKNDGVTRWMATTQFQATSARQAFPCYDEPSFKAFFDITIRRPLGYSSWSNMRLSQSINSTIVGYEEDQYHTTPYMSTYLLAIIVADYESLRVLNSAGDLTYEVIARPEAINDGQGQYALTVGQELLAAMSEHTGIDFYDMDQNIKMTQASIPDFSAGAMENWGLLTYREAYLMYHDEHTNSYFKQLIAYILSHEIAHMWFGNYVTCDWWDVLWLNEGFARYYQYFLTHWVETDMGFETRFIIEQVHASLLSDSDDNAHPLTNPGIGSPAEVRTMFSTITYNKGAAVIRMTEHLLGFEVHRQGLHNYLTDHAYDMALPIDLFQALQDVANSTGAIAEYGSDFSVIDYYYSWTDQAGHPVINVHVDHTTGDMTIQQRRFSINTGYSTTTTNYIVPITFASASNPDFTNTKPTYILKDTVAVINRNSTGDEWVVFNIQQTGFYRVNYDSYTWNLIVLALREDPTVIHQYNRAQIVNDVFQFARSGIMTYNEAFNILSFLENDRDYAPWVAAMTGFTWLRNRLAGTSQLADVNAMIIRWASNVMGDIGYYPTANEDFMTSYLRWQLAPIMCALNVPECRQAANAQFQQLVTTSSEVPADSRNWVYCNGLRDGTEADFNTLWSRFESHHVYTEKILLLQTLGCTPHQNSLNTFMDGIVQENELVRPQDYTTAWNTAAAGNEENTQLVFQYIQNNLQNVSNAFNGLATPLSYVSSRLRTEQEINAFQTWATNNQATLGTSYQTVINGAESTRQSIQWAASVYDDINTYIVNGNAAIELTTPTPDEDSGETTETAPDLVEPETPDIPDSGVTTFLSMSVLTLAVIAKLL